jgi:hypothetical protein
LPDILDDFRERERGLARWLDVEAGDVLEIPLAGSINRKADEVPKRPLGP